MVDDAHASGVLGRNGRGTVDHFDLHGRVDIQVGTLSKAIGVMGGYIAGRQHLKDYLIQRCRTLLFSTSQPPAVAAACIAAIDVLENEPERIERLWDNTRFFKAGLQRPRLRHGHLRDADHAGHRRRRGQGASSWRPACSSEGVFATSVVFPTVAAGQGARAHDRDQRALARRPPDLPRRFREGGARAAAHLSHVAGDQVGLPRRRRDPDRRDARLDGLGGSARHDAVDLHGGARRGHRRRRRSPARCSSIVRRPDWRELEPEFERRYGGFQPSRSLSRRPLRRSTPCAQPGIGRHPRQPAGRRTAELRALGIDPDVMAMSDELGVHKPNPSSSAESLELTGQSGTHRRRLRGRPTGQRRPTFGGGRHARGLAAPRTVGSAGYRGARRCSAGRRLAD